MLYGNKIIQEDVLSAVGKYSEENGIIPIFGAMVGSFSKGTNYMNSDYDTRFLYVKRNFPEEVYLPKKMREEEIKQRLYPGDNRIWEWIPFWEFSAFLQFLVEPSFLNDFSCGLYNIVGWTFKSPYIWDPYGLANKLLPLIDDIFVKEYEIQYHLRNIEKYYEWDTNKEEVIIKNYLDAIHSALTIEWCLQKDSQPPIYFETLLSFSQRKIKDFTVRMINEGKGQAEKIKNFRIDGALVSGELSSHHYLIKGRREKFVDEYIISMYSEGKKIADGYRLTDSEIIEKQIIIDEMYAIVAHSIEGKKELK